MLQHEYQAMIDTERSKRDKRSWVFTVIMSVFTVIPIVGIVAVWHHALKDTSLFLTIVLPLGIFAFLAGCIALDGRPRTLMELVRIMPDFWSY